MTARTVLITGASGKLGRVLVGHFLGRGDLVVACVRRPESVRALLAEHGERSANLVTVASDLTTTGGLDAMMRELATRALQPEALINSARNVEFLAIGQDGRVARGDFMSELMLDVVVPYELTIALAAQPGSRLRWVVNMGSQYGVVAANPQLYTEPMLQSPVHYGVAKAALVHLTKELAVRLAARGIQVNCIAFGGVEGRVDEQFKARYARLCPTGRMLRDDEIAGPVELLVSEQGSGITGHTLVVDGGWSIW